MLGEWEHLRDGVVRGVEIRNGFERFPDAPHEIGRARLLFDEERPYVRRIRVWRWSARRQSDVAQLKVADEAVVRVGVGAATGLPGRERAVEMSTRPDCGGFGKPVHEHLVREL